jgi:hypothetical protein
MKNKEVNIIRILVPALFVLFCSLSLNAQTSSEPALACEMLKSRGEVIIRFIRPLNVSMDELTRNLSIDKRCGDTITAYASEKQFKWFTGKHIPFSVLAFRSVKNPQKGHGKTTATAWDAYPSYAQYLQLMESFAQHYPDQCVLHEFGTTVEGRKLLAVKVSDNPAIDESEPVFLYTSTIHGDEGTGYMLMLRLIDSLLTSYNSNNTIKQLVDKTEIWINPLFNPDGFYFASDSLSFNSRRYNANNADLNRNFPDPVAGDHPDDLEWQPETIAMMDFMKQCNIVLAANLHDGAELVNYPWDSRSERHADDSWFATLSRRFADTVHYYGPAGLFTDENNGITNGSDWYTIHGGRQDYVNYFLHGREVTIELSHVKSIDPSELTAFWDYYKKSLIGYMQQIHPGIQGTVTDAVTGEPLKTMIEIPGHDRDSSQVFSSAETGEFYRLLPEGNYTIRITAPGYSPQENEFSLTAKETKEMTASLLPSGGEFICYPNPFKHTLTFLFPDESKNDLTLVLTDITGRVIRHEIMPGIQGYASLTGLDRLARGVYQVRIRKGSLAEEIKVIK